ncbi:MAG: T9SS type A sorting domain-containing protein, partial [Candidatus Cloacimonadales bacterium]
EYDLAGYPRIYGDAVDMGAFEFQGEQPAFDDNIISIPKASISIYPNPFNPTTTVKLSLEKSSQVNISVFNIKGQKVITLTDRFIEKGIYNFHWSGVDNNNKQVSSGQYLVKLSINGTEKAVEKCILLK